MLTHFLDTDQVTCYDSDGHVIPCEGTGQDADKAKQDMQPLQRRFMVHCCLVEDTYTGAMWTRDANPFHFPMTWHEAQASVATMRDQRMHGCDNWQLPSRNLLFSLISHQSVNPAIIAHDHFENIFNGYYWTRDTYSRLPEQAWYAHLGGGRIYRGMKHGSYLVWPVCPSETLCLKTFRNVAHRFVVEEGCVHDTRTGLTWTRDANPLNHGLSWKAALAAVKAMNSYASKGEQHWRLPTIRELESLVALDSHSPALPAGHPFVNVQDVYWSSTTSVYEPRYAWAMYLRDGSVGVGFKPGEDFYAWPVSNGNQTALE